MNQARLTISATRTLTESETVAGISGRLREVCDRFGAELTVRQADPATYYPREAPVARAYLDLLRDVSGREPTILHSAGASNGRIYVTKDPDIHVLMTSPAIGSSHADEEYLEVDSLEPYYRLVYESAKLRWS